MSVAYLDTSCAVAIALGEPAAAHLIDRLGKFDELVSSNLFEAELRAVLRREQLNPTVFLELGEVSWIIPGRPLSAEIERVLEAGYIRGADCWHLASALHFSPNTTEITFLTLDERQRTIAEKMEFQT